MSSFTRIRKQLLDKLIADFRALKHYDGTSTMFNAVQRIYLDLPEILPSAQIIPIGADVDNDMIDFDNRQLNFSLIVFENLEENGTQDTIDIKIDRLCDIEDGVLRYIEQIPNNVGIVNGEFRVYKTAVNNVRWNYGEGVNGMALYLIVEFGCFVQLTVKDM